MQVGMSQVRLTSHPILERETQIVPHLEVEWMRRKSRKIIKTNM